MRVQRHLEEVHAGVRSVRGASRSARRFGRAALAIAVAASSSGCYSYHRVELETVAPSTDVRLYLTWAGLDGRQDLVEAGVVSTDERPVVRGTLLEWDPSTVTLGVRVRDPDYYPETTPLEQHVSLPLNSIWDAEARTLHPFETGLMVAGGVAAAALIVRYIIGDAVNNGKNQPPLEDWDENRLPLPALHFSR